MLGEAQRRHHLVARAMVAHLVVEEHGVLGQEFPDHRDALHVRGQRALFLGAPRLPVAQRNARGARRGGKRQ